MLSALHIGIGLCFMLPTGIGTRLLMLITILAV